MSETLSKMYLELAHVVPEETKTFRELALEKRIKELEGALEEMTPSYERWQREMQEVWAEAADRIEELEAENTELKAQIADINDMLAMAERAGR